MVRWFLFETRVGDWFIGWLERSVGVGVVAVDAGERSSGVVGVSSE